MSNPSPPPPFIRKSAIFYLCSGRRLGSALTLSRASDEGVIRENGTRIITFRIRTFQRLIQKCEKTFGTGAVTIFYSEGMAVGEAGMEYSRSQIASDEDLWTVLDKVVAVRGWGRIIDMKISRDDDRVAYVFQWKNTPIAYEERSNGPVCHFCRGVLVGWLQAYYGKKAVDSKETRCEAVGDPYCEFEILFKPAIVEKPERERLDVDKVHA